jgi:hypothetical protein
MFMSTHAHREGAPQPWPAPFVLCLALAGVAVGVGDGAGLTGAALVEAPITFAVLGLVLAAARALRAARQRADANDWIRRGYESRFRWRVAELTSRRERKTIARSVRGVIRELDAGAPLGPVPLNRRALRANRSLLEALSGRLVDLRPVSAAGMVAVEHLLTHPESPLFPHHADAEPNLAKEIDALARAITAAIDGLEVR